MPTISSVGPIAVDPNSVLTGDGTVCHPLGLAPTSSFGNIVTVPYNALDFWADGGGVWTVPIDAFNCLYYVQGKRVTITLYIDHCTVSPNNVVTVLKFRLPTAVSNIVAWNGPANSEGPIALFGGTAIVLHATSVPDGVFQGAWSAAIGPSAPPGWSSLTIGLMGVDWPGSFGTGYRINASCTYIIA